MFLQSRQGGSCHLTSGSPPPPDPSSPCGKVCPSLECVLSCLSQSAPTYTPALRHQCSSGPSVYLFLQASPNFPVWNQVFYISFILCMSRVLSVSVSIRSAVEIGWKVVKETPSRDGLLESVLSAPWRVSGQINQVAESLSGLGLLKVRGLTKWDSSVDPSTKSRIWSLLSQQEKLGRGWLLSFDSWFWNILQQWVDYSGLFSTWVSSWGSARAH